MTESIRDNYGHDFSSPDDQEAQTEMAAKNFERALASYLKATMEGRREAKKPCDNIASFIGHITTERLENAISQLAPTDQAEFFESIHTSYFDMRVKRLPFDKNASIYLDIGGKSRLSPDLKRILATELIRTNILALAADPDIKGKGLLETSSSTREFKMNEWLDIYTSLLKQPKTEDQNTYPADLIVYSPENSPTKTQDTRSAYDIDPHLFADLMIAAGIHDGATSASSFSEAWKKNILMYDNNAIRTNINLAYKDKYGFQGHIPYRTKLPDSDIDHREADMERILQNLGTFDQIDQANSNSAVEQTQKT